MQPLACRLPLRLLLLLSSASFSSSKEEACTPHNTGDTKFKTCAAFCKEEQAKNHCSWCKCNTCAFCGSNPPTKHHEDHETSGGKQAGQPHTTWSGSKQAGQPHAAAGGGKPVLAGSKCSSGLGGDTEVEGCAAFCKEDKATNHCRYCKCRQCPFCTAVLRSNREANSTTATQRTPCKSSLTGDFTYRACASFCSPTRAATHCPFCKCSDCPYCLPGVASPPPSPRHDVGGEPHSSILRRLVTLLAVSCSPAIFLFSWWLLAPASVGPMALKLAIDAAVPPTDAVDPSESPRLLPEVTKDDFAPRANR